MDERPLYSQLNARLKEKGPGNWERQWRRTTAPEEPGTYYIMRLDVLQENYEDVERFYNEHFSQGEKIATIKVIAPESKPTPTPEPKEPLKLINDTLELTEGKSKSYTVKSNGGSLIVKAKGLDEMFLIKNKYTIEILKDGEPFVTYNEEFSTLEPEGDPAKIEIILPPGDATYTVTITCDDVGELGWWKFKIRNGEKTQIIVFSSLHTTKSAKAMYSTYEHLAVAWSDPAGKAMTDIIAFVAGDPTTLKGTVGIFAPEMVSALVTAINMILNYEEWCEQIGKDLGQSVNWRMNIAPRFRETNAQCDFGELECKRKIEGELIELYTKTKYSPAVYWSRLAIRNVDSLNVQLGAMAHLNAKTYVALKKGQFEEAKYYMQAQKEFIPHLGWIAIEEAKLSSYARLYKSDPYYEVWLLTRALVRADMDRIGNYFSERTPPQ